MAKWFSARLGTKWLWVRVPLQSLKFQISSLVSSKEFLDIQATIECGFTLTPARDMIRTYSQLYDLFFREKNLKIMKNLDDFLGQWWRTSNKHLSESAYQLTLTDFLYQHNLRFQLTFYIVYWAIVYWTIYEHRLGSFNN